MYVYHVPRARSRRTLYARLTASRRTTLRDEVLRGTNCELQRDSNRLR